MRVIIDGATYVPEATLTRVVYPDSSHLVRDLAYFRSETAKAGQTIHVYNQLPWYKKILIFHIEPKCQMRRGYNCCCIDGKHYE